MSWTVEAGSLDPNMVVDFPQAHTIFAVWKEHNEVLSHLMFQTTEGYTYRIPLTKNASCTFLNMVGND